MVTKKMQTYGKVVAELDYNVYKAKIGSIRNHLPRHAYISPERVAVEGRKKVRLWCLYPDLGKEAVERALSEQNELNGFPRVLVRESTKGSPPGSSNS